VSLGAGSVVAQERQDRLFESGLTSLGQAGLGQVDDGAGFITVEDARIDVGVLGDRRGVAQIARDLLDGGLDRALPRCRRVARFGARRQRGRGQQSEAQAMGWLSRVFLSVLPI
jgi:hypothetical protein